MISADCRKQIVASGVTVDLLLEYSMITEILEKTIPAERIGAAFVAAQQLDHVRSETGTVRMNDYINMIKSIEAIQQYAREHGQEAK